MKPHVAARITCKLVTCMPGAHRCLKTGTAWPSLCLGGLSTQFVQPGSFRVAGLLTWTINASPVPAPGKRTPGGHSLTFDEQPWKPHSITSTTATGQSQRRIQVEEGEIDSNS